jgi:RNA polymerase sigma-B factor
MLPSVSSPLLREWDLLQERVVPHLLDVGGSDRRPQIWSVGSVADAVAVVTAYRHARRERREESGDLTAFASVATRALSPVTFSLSEVRGVPARVRSASFERHDHSWVPGAEISEQVLLTEPYHPVDLVTLRPEADDHMVEQAIDLLREGGHLLLMEPWPGMETKRGLRSVDGARRMYRKGSRGRPAQRRPGRPPFAGRPDPDRAGPEQDAPATTLAAHQAQSDLVAGHIRLARSLARRFSHHGESKEDLEQVALMALVKAARRYDASRQTSFSTYATASILGEIKRHFRDKTWMMRVPRSVQERYLAVKEARESLTHDLSCSPTIQQIAARLRVSDEAVLEAMEAGENYWPDSLDVGLFEGETGRDVPVEDGGFDMTVERQQLTALLPRLAPRERLILKRTYFDGWTQRQVAEEIGVSQMQVSRLLGRTVDNLRSWIAEE